MDNSMVLNRLFTQNTFKELLNEDMPCETYMSVIRRYASHDGDKNNADLISEIYSYMRKNYRNEYFYKNTLLNKLLLGVHKPTTTTALTEIPVGKSKADFILINGKAIVYEIKTALDTFERLESQLSDYYKAFDHVAVVTDSKNRTTIEKILSNTPVGIYLMTERDQISPLKKPMRYREKLSASEIFKVMNKDEYESVLMQIYSKLPEVAPVWYYSKCQEMFCDVDLSVSYPLFLKELKKRNKIIIEQYKDVPYELKTLVYFSKYKQNDYLKLHEFLTRNFEEGE